MSAVTAIPAAPADEALRHFEVRVRLPLRPIVPTSTPPCNRARRISSCSTPAAQFRRFMLKAMCRAPSACRMARSSRAAAIACYAADTLFVVYCAGPHCNGAARAAVRLASLGRPVKLMAGGITGWMDEGFVLQAGAE